MPSHLRFPPSPFPKPEDKSLKNPAPFFLGGLLRPQATSPRAIQLTHRAALRTMLCSAFLRPPFHQSFSRKWFSGPENSNFERPGSRGPIPGAAGLQLPWLQLPAGPLTPLEPLAVPCPPPSAARPLRKARPLLTFFAVGISHRYLSQKQQPRQRQGPDGRPAQSRESWPCRVAAGTARTPQRPTGCPGSPSPQPRKNFPAMPFCSFSPGTELRLPLSVLGTVCQLVEEALQGERQERWKLRTVLLGRIWRILLLTFVQWDAPAQPASPDP